MKTDPMKPDRRSRLDTRSRFSGVRSWPVAGVVVLLLAGAALWCRSDAQKNATVSVPPIRVIGKLPAQDVAEIKRLVRREIWRGILPRFDWWSIRNLPAAVRYRASQRIFGITVRPDGTVGAWAGHKVRDLFFGQWTYSYEYSYLLKKGTRGWQLIQVSQWGEGCEG